MLIRISEVKIGFSCRLIIKRSTENFKSLCSNECMNMGLIEGCSNNKCKKCNYCKEYLNNLNLKCSTSCRNLSLSEGCSKIKCKNCKYCSDYLKQIRPFCKNISMDKEYKKHMCNNHGDNTLSKNELLDCLMDWQKLIHTTEILK